MRIGGILLALLLVASMMSIAVAETKLPDNFEKDPKVLKLFYVSGDNPFLITAWYQDGKYHVVISIKNDAGETITAIYESDAEGFVDIGF